jgi:O-antigen/teichoic acid export membrane protein
MAASYLVMPLFLSAQSIEVVTAARWYLLVVPISALVGMPIHPLRGRNDFAVWNGLRITPNIVWLIVLLMAWRLERVEPQFIAAGYLMTLAALVFPIMYVVGWRVPGPFWPESPQWKPMLHYGLPSMISSVPQMLNLRLDQMLMASLLPAESLGLYVVAVAWSNATHPLLSALGAVVFPHVASQDNHERRAKALAQYTRLGGLVSLGIAMVLAITTPWVVSLLFGEKFAEAVPAALVLVVAGAIAGLNTVIEDGLRGMGYPSSVMRAEFGGLAVTALSLVILLRPLGIMGAALASLLGYGAVGILLVAQGRWLTGFPLSAFLRPTRRELHIAWRRIYALSGGMIGK